MVAVLAFVGALVAIVLVAIVVSRVRGARAHYLDAWSPDPGEHRLLEDRPPTSTSSRDWARPR